MFKLILLALSTLIITKTSSAHHYWYQWYHALRRQNAVRQREQSEERQKKVEEELRVECQSKGILPSETNLTYFAKQIVHGKLEIGVAISQLELNHYVKKLRKECIKKGIPTTGSNLIDFAKRIVHGKIEFHRAISQLKRQQQLDFFVEILREGCKSKRIPITKLNEFATRIMNEEIEIDQAIKQLKQIDEEMKAAEIQRQAKPISDQHESHLKKLRVHPKSVDVGDIVRTLKEQCNCADVPPRELKELAQKICDGKRGIDAVINQIRKRERGGQKEQSVERAQSDPREHGQVNQIGPVDKSSREKTNASLSDAMREQRAERKQSDQRDQGDETGKSDAGNGAEKNGDDTSGATMMYVSVSVIGCLVIGLLLLM